MEKRYHFQRALIPGPVTASVSCKKKKKNKRREKRASRSLFFLFFLPDGNPVCQRKGVETSPFSWVLDGMEDQVLARYRRGICAER